MAANSEARAGVLFALGAYVLWGLLPLYWRALKGIPLGETLAHRVVWSLVTILLLLAMFGRLRILGQTLGDEVKRRRLLQSAVLIATNWTLYILAVHWGHVVEASLGYYINPLMSVALGVAFLKERLSRVQAVAVAGAALGVVLLGWQHGGLPWIALGLAVSFALYGLIKKRLLVDGLTGLAVETLWITPLALLYLAWLGARSESQGFQAGARTAWLLLGTGAVTLAPLFLFNGAARRLRLSTLGFIQYLSPTIQLVLAVYVFGEPFTTVHGVAFGLIWVALVLYSWDAWRAHVALSRVSAAQ